MILYFSATGNTKYIASELAKALNDSIIDLREKIREKDYTPIHSTKPFVICSPVYVSEPPRFLMDFLRKTRLTGNPNVYFVVKLYCRKPVCCTGYDGNRKKNPPGTAKD